jgi:hypothetical protein
VILTRRGPSPRATGGGVGWPSPHGARRARTGEEDGMDVVALLMLAILLLACAFGRMA